MDKIEKAIGNKRIIGIIAIFILFGVSVIVVEYIGKNALNGVRGYIYGEGRWSKAQKEATVALLKYLYEQDDAYYAEFDEALLVIDGSRAGRETLTSNEPDLQVAYEGFLQGGNHPDDIDNMIWVFQRFQNVDLIRQAVEYWEAGDYKIDELREVAAELHDAITVGEMDSERQDQFLERISLLDEELTVLEVEFSNTMNSASRWANRVVFWSTILISLAFILVASFVSISFIRSLKYSNEKLTASEKKFRNVLDNSRDVIYQHDKTTNRYDYISSSVADMLGFSAEQVLEGGPEFMLERVHPEDRKRMEAELNRLRSRGDEPDLKNDTEFRVQKADGSYIWVNNKRKPVIDENGEIIAIVGNVRDISDRKKQMDQIDKSLKEKQMMLAEIHHRVKNNLAIVSSLIEMQKGEMDESVADEFQELQLRIKSIALVHEKLYSTESFSEVNLSQYLRELVDMISGGYRLKDRKIDINYELDDVEVNITKAVPIGLICNELVNNAFKHAFNDKSEGRLIVRLLKKNGTYELSVTDDGGALPADFSINDQKSLGMTLLIALSKQLNGELNVQGNSKTTFSVNFKA